MSIDTIFSRHMRGCVHIDMFIHISRHAPRHLYAHSKSGTDLCLDPPCRSFHEEAGSTGTSIRTLMQAYIRVHAHTSSTLPVPKGKANFSGPHICEHLLVRYFAVGIIVFATSLQSWIVFVGAIVGWDVGASVGAKESLAQSSRLPGESDSSVCWNSSMSGTRDGFTASLLLLVFFSNSHFPRGGGAPPKVKQQQPIQNSVQI